MRSVANEAEKRTNNGNAAAAQNAAPATNNVDENHIQNRNNFFSPAVKAGSTKLQIFHAQYGKLNTTAITAATRNCIRKTSSNEK